MASGKNIKDVYEASGTFTGVLKDPEDIIIVGHDIEIEDWNEDAQDEARLVHALRNPLDPEKTLKILELGGQIEPINIVKRRNTKGQDVILTVDGRRRILVCRKANKLLIARGEKPEGLIQIRCLPTKSSDLSVAVRTSNSGRLEDPPWVKAKNAGVLMARGRTIEDIQAIEHVQSKITVKNWLYYLDLDPEIMRLIEDPDVPEDQQLPFAIGIELAKGSGNGEHGSGKGYFKDQQLALKFLRDTNAQLTGEKGRENAKAAIRAVKAGDIVPPPKKSQPLAQPLVPSHTPAPASPSRPEPPAAPPPAAPPPAAPPAPSRPPRITVASPKMSWGSIRAIGALLEPSENDPHKTEADRLAYAMNRVYQGQDPTAAGLAEWPDLQAKFRKVVKSPAPEPYLAL